MKKPSIQNMRTPKWLFKQLEKHLGVTFYLDAAASRENALCAHYLTEEDNALIQPWGRHSYVFCNPPFKHFAAWIWKARLECEVHDNFVCLIGPVGCSQSWFRAHAPFAHIYCPTRRISFDNPDGTPTHSADRDTMIYVFAPLGAPEQDDPGIRGSFLPL